MIIMPGPTDKCSRHECCQARLDVEVLALFLFLTSVIEVEAVRQDGQW
jgi:hypothetical protein